MVHIGETDYLMDSMGDQSRDQVPTQQCTRWDCGVSPTMNRVALTKILGVAEMTTLQATQTPTAAPTAREPVPRKFTVDEYDRMVEAGILGPEDKVELIEGTIYDMPPQSARHAACIQTINHLLVRALSTGFQVRPQLPLDLSPDSEPEPDFAVVSTNSGDVIPLHPGPDSIHLIIEVMLPSVRMDRQWKLPLYAKHGIREVWLVNLNRHHVEVHTAPDGERFSDVRIVNASDEIVCAAIPDLSFRGSDLLGPRVADSSGEE